MIRGLGVAVPALLALSIGAAEAQNRTYERWQDPNTVRQAEYKTPEHTRKMVQELRELLRVGRRDRAASPAFLDDLEDALSTHRRADQALIGQSGQASVTTPRSTRLSDIEDDFRDGDFTRNPAWKLVRGEFFVAQGSRLFSFVQPQSSQRPKNDADAINQIFGALLGGKRQTQSNQDQASAEPAAIFLPGEITNAFDIRTRLMSDSRTGGILELGVYQGADGKNGYRVQFSGDGIARLLRVGRNVVELRDAAFNFPQARNGRPGTYDVRWTRDRKGQMRVLVNGALVMRAADNGFRDNFDGFRMVNAEGRHGMDAIRIGMSN